MAQWIPPAPTEAPPEAKNTLIRDHGLSPETVERLASAFNLLDKDQDGVLSEADLRVFYLEEANDYGSALKALTNFDEERAEAIQLGAGGGTKVDFLTFALATHTHMNGLWKDAFNHAKQRLTAGLQGGSDGLEGFRKRMKDWCDVDLTAGEAERLFAAINRPGNAEKPKDAPAVAKVTSGSNANPAAEKYLKMLAVGVPRPAVEIKIRRDGLDPADLLPDEA